MNDVSGPPREPAEKRRHVFRLLAGTVAMFAFGYALVPLYSVICDITGINGQDRGLLQATTVDAAVDTRREVRIEFVTTVNGGRDWHFAPLEEVVSVHPGEARRVLFQATNPDAKAAVIQAVPSISPWRAARYLRKTECFCFNQQRFEAGEHKDMPVVFVIDPELPDDVDTLTLSYTLFDITRDEVATR